MARRAASSRMTFAVLVALVAALLPARVAGAASGDASDTVAKYVRAWRQLDYSGMLKRIHKPPSDFVTTHRQVLSDMHAKTIAIRVGRVKENGNRATAKLTNHFTSDLGEWDGHGVLSLKKVHDQWKVRWSTAEFDAALGPDTHISSDLQWPERALILGAGGQPLTVQGAMVRVGIQGSRVTDPNAVTTALQLAGAPPNQIQSALATARDHPDWFVPVIEIPDPQYQQIKPQIFPVPGTAFQTFGRRETITPGLAAHLVGVTGPITAEQLNQLGPPYDENDTVGRGGMEAQYERQLAGSPAATIRIVDANNRLVSTLASFPAKPATAVQTTIDPNTQRAAEAALGGVNRDAAIVAIRASTGEVLASAMVPDSNGFNIPLRGQYPPGSTFKIITSADMLEHGFTPSSQLTCPPTINVAGQTFRNFEGEAADSLDFTTAFALSCNNAFIGAAKDLPLDSLPAVAAKFGLGKKADIGVDAFGGSVPTPTTPNEQAATSIGQAKVEVSPMAMAGVAGAVASGTWHAPRLVAGAPNDSVPPMQLDPGVVDPLRSMMAAVVARGTASGAGLPPGTFGKTGTAEFGSGNPPQTHAWFVGYRGDVAFAVLVPNGGVGGAVAAPIAARFLNALGG